MNLIEIHPDKIKSIYKKNGIEHDSYHLAIEALKALKPKI